MVTRTTFNSQTNSLFADNTTGDISAADLRQQMDNVSDSVAFKTATANAPDANDDSASDRQVGDIWVDSSGAVYVCTDASVGSAVWAPVSNQTDIITQTVITIGVGADFATVESTQEWLASRRLPWPQTLTINLPSGTVDTPIRGHIDGHRIFWTGAALTGSLPTLADGGTAIDNVDAAATQTWWEDEIDGGGAPILTLGDFQFSGWESADIAADKIVNEAMAQARFATIIDCGSGVDPVAAQGFHIVLSNVYIQGYSNATAVRTDGNEIGIGGYGTGAGVSQGQIGGGTVRLSNSVISGAEENVLAWGSGSSVVLDDVVSMYASNGGTIGNNLRADAGGYIRAVECEFIGANAYSISSNNLSSILVDNSIAVGNRLSGVHVEHGSSISFKNGGSFLNGEYGSSLENGGSIVTTASKLKYNQSHGVRNVGGFIDGSNSQIEYNGGYGINHSGGGYTNFSSPSGTISYNELGAIFGSQGGVVSANQNTINGNKGTVFRAESNSSIVIESASVGELYDAASIPDSIALINESTFSFNRSTFTDCAARLTFNSANFDGALSNFSGRIARVFEVQKGSTGTLANMTITPVGGSVNAFIRANNSYIDCTGLTSTDDANTPNALTAIGTATIECDAAPAYTTSPAVKTLGSVDMVTNLT